MKRDTRLRESGGCQIGAHLRLPQRQRAQESGDRTGGKTIPAPPYRDRERRKGLTERRFSEREGRSSSGQQPRTSQQQCPQRKPPSGSRLVGVGLNWGDHCRGVVACCRPTFPLLSAVLAADRMHGQRECRATERVRPCLRASSSLLQTPKPSPLHTQPQHSVFLSFSG